MDRSCRELVVFHNLNSTTSALSRRSWPSCPVSTHTPLVEREGTPSSIFAFAVTGLPVCLRIDVDLVTQCLGVKICCDHQGRSPPGTGCAM